VRADQLADGLAALTFLDPLLPVENILIGILEGFESNQPVSALLLSASFHVGFPLSGVLPIKPVGQTGKTSVFPSTGNTNLGRVKKHGENDEFQLQGHRGCDTV
jgi:hypothetical protein